MRRHPRTTFLALLLLAISVPVLASGQDEVEKVIDLTPPLEHPEGITFDRDGNLYYGHRTLVPADGTLENRIVEVAPDGDEQVIAVFAPSPLPGNGILGLVADDSRNVWAAIDGGDDHGVWRVAPDGTKSRVDGSEEIHFPNALTIDARGNLYVTDSGPVVPPVGGAIWRLAHGESTIEVWLEDDALAPFPPLPSPPAPAAEPFGFPAPGANGIAFFPPRSLFVANTEKGQLLHVPILADGSAGELEAVTAIGAVPAIDGIAVDVNGDVHAVLAGSLVLGTPPLVRVDTDSGQVFRTTPAAYDDLFDTALSLAFDTRPGERDNLWITAGDLDNLNELIPPVGDGPGILRAEAGVKGFPVK